MQAVPLSLAGVQMGLIAVQEVLPEIGFASSVRAAQRQAAYKVIP